MTFTTEQLEKLSGPLNRAHVKPPAPGKYGDYIEGWRTIDEANRIFGFDGWTRDTIEMVETNRDLRGDKFHVGYRAKVRVVAGGIFRDGTGFGSGVSKQLGDAIESAVKEAETDAMKRALMTFGNPFGLALYDKTQSNVVEMPPEPPASVQLSLDGIAKCETQIQLKEWWDRNGAAVPDHYVEQVVAAIEERKKAIRTMDQQRAV